jgi:hypothetical protein
MDGISNYHALTARLTKRFSQGLSALVSYTYAKEMDYNGGDSSEVTLLQDDNHPRADYSVGDVNTGQRLVISPAWQLPFGSGQHFLNSQGLVNALAGGWELSGIVTMQTGTLIPYIPPQTTRTPDRFSTARPNLQRQGARNCRGMV